LKGVKILEGIFITIVVRDDDGRRFEIQGYREEVYKKAVERNDILESENDEILLVIAGGTCIYSWLGLRQYPLTWDEVTGFFA
jgi:hypothetical protein